MDVDQHGPADGSPAGGNDRAPTGADRSSATAAPIATTVPSEARAPSGAAPSTEPEFSTLSPKVLLMWRTGWAIVGVVTVLVVLGVGIAATDLPVALRAALPVVALGAVVVLVAVVPPASYRRWRYRVTDDGLDLQHGLVVRQQSSIPHFRVQHVDVRRGLIQRQLGIVSLTISTASPATDAQLPGLDPERAEAIRRRVLDGAGADDGV